MNKFVPGQRWISKPELQMGLGTVTATDFRRVTIVFLATGETRTYSVETAPLTRAEFLPGDTIKSHEGWSLKVETVEETEGLLTYQGVRDDGSDSVLHEGELDNFMQLNRPSDRLLSGQIDQSKWFELRYQSLQYANALAHSDLHGLVGTRTTLIPHQLYIAHEVASRFAPRVLLADEVGLGKTIEAGMILHHQLITGRADRVLIVVPDNLVHQWLVEMLRRFNLHFSIFDEERFEGEKESTGQDNPFHTEQFILCSLSFLTGNEEYFNCALDGDWDLLVVDEAHHLEWSPAEASIEYHCIDMLAKATKGVLLLTATPEQLGKESHYARLRLLDPDRFPDYQSFVEEEKSYEPIASAIEELFENKKLSEKSLSILNETLEEGDNQKWLNILQEEDSVSDNAQLARHELMDHLLDRHGTGRVLFRNTRSAIKGFPERKLLAYPLDTPEQYLQSQKSIENNIYSAIRPEFPYKEAGSDDGKEWPEFDPRVACLIRLLKENKSEKILVIAAHMDTVLDLADALRIKEGIHAAVFHEQLSIIDRDKAAAYFADEEYGSQVLICSEIGSEGRNFQFAHHLVLFDLPVNPDLLEQRIGRLDRIGQTQTIKIHIPYLKSTGQEVLFRWYHEGLMAFENTCAVGSAIFEEFKNDLTKHVINAGSDLSLDTLLQASHDLYVTLNDALQSGRDRLLEYNSCRPAIAEALKLQALELDAESGPDKYMERAFDCFGVEVEDHISNSYVLHPGDHMHSGNFPSLNSEGMTITFDRNIALSYEDIHFITWEHPMTLGVMDMILSQEHGNSAMVAIKHKSFKPGTLMVEALYLLESAAKSSFHLSRYFPPTTLRVVIDNEGNEYGDDLSHKAINKVQSAINNEIMFTVVRSHSDEIKSLIARSDQLVKQLAPEKVEQARSRANELLQKEVDRLNALKEVNPNIRDDEISYFLDQKKLVNQVLDDINPRLEAIRVIIAT